MAGRGGTETTSYQDYDQGANSSGPIGEFGTEFEPQPEAARAAYASPEDGEEDAGEEDAGEEDAGEEDAEEE